jgi:hypothetical protein
MLNASESCQRFIHLCARGWDTGVRTIKTNSARDTIHDTYLSVLQSPHNTQNRRLLYSLWNCRMSSQIPKAAFIYCISSRITDITRSKIHISYDWESRTGTWLLLVPKFI